MALTPKQKTFINEYLIDLNATQAAIRAGYSEKTAEVIGFENLRKPQIAEVIEKRMKDREERTEITQDRVLKELALIAFSDATDFAKVVEKEAFTEIDGETVPVLDAEGNPVKYRTVELELTDNLPEDKRHAIATIKKGRDGLEQKPYDKLRALELIGKHVGMFVDKVNVTGEMKVNDPYAELTTEDLKKLINDG